MSGTALTFPTPVSLGSLDHYIQAVNRFPLLTQEQETAAESNKRIEEPRRDAEQPGRLDSTQQSPG